MPHNPFKTALQNGETQIGLWSAMCSPVAVEIGMHAGFDFMMLDTEHAPTELADLWGLLQALAGSDTHAAVRLAWNDRTLIKRALDMGAQTVMVPFVQTREEAHEAALSVDYPMRGMRGVAGGTRATRFGREKGYFQTARDGICLLVQVETGEALDRLEDIATVEGVDGVFIGPSDLAASMGHIGNPGHPDVQAALEKAAQRLAAVGVPSGILAVSEEDAHRYRGWGYRFIPAGIDTSLLTAAVDARKRAMMG